MQRSLVVASLLAVSGCATFHARIPTASAPVEPAACAGIWSAAFAELHARGFTIAASDPARGTVRTETMVIPGRVPCGHLECAYRDTVHVTVAPTGEVAVRIARELSIPSVVAIPGAVLAGDRWEPPASTQRSTIAGVVADQDVLLRAILQRAAAPPRAAQASAATPPASGPAPAGGAGAAPVAPAVVLAPVPAVADAAHAPVAPASIPAPAPPPSAMTVPTAPPPAGEPAPAAGAAREAAPARRFRLVGSLGYDYGFEDLLTVTYDKGGTDRLGANGGFVFSGGAAWLVVPSGEVELRATAGMKYDVVMASNGEAYYVAFPVELLAAWNVRPLRLSGGASLALWPRVRGSGFLAEADLDLRSSLGVVGQAEWVLPFRFGTGSASVGLRYLWQKLEASTGGRAIDASALGIVAGVTL
jgi:hypothetical protein